MKPIKIKIKSIFGNVVFTHESENNTIKKTVEKFLRENEGKVINEVDLSNLGLSGINFSSSKFSNSKFSNSKFSNSKFNEIKVKKIDFFNGLYKYVVIPIIAKDGNEHVKMGCYTRPVEEWEKDFWNNAI